MIDLVVLFGLQGFESFADVLCVKEQALVVEILLTICLQLSSICTFCKLFRLVLIFEYWFLFFERECMMWQLVESRWPGWLVIVESPRLHLWRHRYRLLDELQSVLRLLPQFLFDLMQVTEEFYVCLFLVLLLMEIKASFNLLDVISDASLNLAEALLPCIITNLLSSLLCSLLTLSSFASFADSINFGKELILRRGELLGIISNGRPRRWAIHELLGDVLWTTNACWRSGHDHWCSWSFSIIMEGRATNWILTAG